jgi:hypothetical protein
MADKIRCPECGKSVTLGPRSRGKKAYCPRCDIDFPVDLRDEDDDARDLKQQRKEARARRRARGFLIWGLTSHFFAATASLVCVVLLFGTLFRAASWFALVSSVLEVPNVVCCLIATPAKYWTVLLISMTLRVAAALMAVAYLAMLGDGVKPSLALPILIGLFIAVSWGLWVGFLMARLEKVGADELKSDLGRAVSSGIGTLIFQAALLGFVAWASRGVRIVSIVGFLSYGGYTFFLYQTTQDPLWKCALNPTAIPFLLDYLTLILGLRVELSRPPRVDDTR